MRSQTIECFSLAPYEFKSGVISLSVEDLPDPIKFHTSPINTLYTCSYCCLVKNRTEDRCWSKRFATSFRLSGQYLPMSITIDKRCGFFQNLDFNGRGGKDEHVRRLLDLVLYLRHWLSHNHHAFPGRWS